MPDNTTSTKTSSNSAKKADEKDTETMSIEVRKDIPADLRDQLIRQLGVRANPVVGNFADLQRGGAHAVLGESDPLKKGVEMHPSVSDEDAKELGASTTAESASN